MLRKLWSGALALVGAWAVWWCVLDAIILLSEIAKLSEL